MTRNHYLCAAGHETFAPVHLRLGRCPVYVLGKPCPAVLKHVGDGSRAKNRALAQQDTP